ncbi:unnamed protein product, partial [marine sediment metagenome]
MDILLAPSKRRADQSLYFWDALQSGCVPSSSLAKSGTS